MEGRIWVGVVGVEGGRWDSGGVRRAGGGGRGAVGGGDGVSFVGGGGGIN